MDEDQASGYDRFGEAYRDWWAPIIAPSAVRLLDRLDGLVAADAAFSLCDVGVGTGTLALAALERWPRATAVGIDPSQGMLDLAAAEARRRADGVASRLTLVRSTAETLRLADASVDLAVSSFVIQLVSSRAGALRELHRVVRPGGVVAVLTWQTDEEPFEPEDMVGLSLDEMEIAAPVGGRDARPYTSPSAAAAEFRRAGFDQVRAKPEWLEHRFTSRSYLDVVEHWIEDDSFAPLDEPRRAELRDRILRRLERLEPDALFWRRPLVSVVARRP